MGCGGYGFYGLNRSCEGCPTGDGIYDCYARWSEITGSLGPGGTYPTPIGLVRYPTLHPGMEVDEGTFGVWLNSRHTSPPSWLAPSTPDGFDPLDQYSAQPATLPNSQVLATLGSDDSEQIWSYETRGAGATSDRFAVQYDPVSRTEVNVTAIDDAITISLMSQSTQAYGGQQLLADNRSGLSTNYRTGVAEDEWATVRLIDNWAELNVNDPSPSGSQPAYDSAFADIVRIRPGDIDRLAYITMWWGDVTISGTIVQSVGDIEIYRVDAIPPRSWPKVGISRTKYTRDPAPDFSSAEFTFDQELLIGDVEYDDSGPTVRGYMFRPGIGISWDRVNDGNSLISTGGESVFSHTTSAIFVGTAQHYFVEPSCGWDILDVNGDAWIGAFHWVDSFTGDYPGTNPPLRVNKRRLACSGGTIEDDYTYHIRSVHVKHGGDGFIVCRTTGSSTSDPQIAVIYDSSGSEIWRTEECEIITCDYSSDRWIYFVGHKVVSGSAVGTFDNDIFPGQVFEWGDDENPPKVFLANLAGTQSFPGGTYSAVTNEVSPYPEDPIIDTTIRTFAPIETRCHEVVRRSSEVGDSLPADANDLPGLIEELTE